MNLFNFDADTSPTFDIDTLRRRKDEARRNEGAKEFAALSSKVFPLFRGHAIDAVFLVALAALEFALQVMEHREKSKKQ